LCDYATVSLHLSTSWKIRERTAEFHPQEWNNALPWFAGWRNAGWGCFRKQTGSRAATSRNDDPIQPREFGG